MDSSRYTRQGMNAKHAGPTQEEQSMVGQLLYCPNCECENPVVKVNKANMRHPDPTETYTLRCGHTVM